MRVARVSFNLSEAGVGRQVIELGESTCSGKTYMKLKVHDSQLRQASSRLKKSKDMKSSRMQKERNASVGVTVSESFQGLYTLLNGLCLLENDNNKL
jgi:hypothetical protein